MYLSANWSMIVQAGAAFEPLDDAAAQDGRLERVPTRDIVYLPVRTETCSGAEQ